jgi:hypothetical protein
MLARLFGGLKPKHRVITIAFVLLLAAWVDSQMGFTYHYFTDKKINEISRYNQILKDDKLDSNTIALVKKERQSVISKNRAFIEFANRDTAPPKNAIFHLSYSWLLIILFVMIPFTTGFQKHLETSKKISQVIWSWVILGVITLITYFVAKGLSFYIKSMFLYIINTTVQILFLYLIWKISLRFTHLNSR